MATLTLSIDKAARHLRWSPVWRIDRAVDETMAWYRPVAAGRDPREETLKQIKTYEADATRLGLAWTV